MASCGSNEEPSGIALREVENGDTITTYQEIVQDSLLMLPGSDIVSSYCLMLGSDADTLSNIELAAFLGGMMVDKSEIDADKLHSSILQDSSVTIFTHRDETNKSVLVYYQLRCYPHQTLGVAFNAAFVDSMRNSDEVKGLTDIQFWSDMVDFVLQSDKLQYVSTRDYTSKSGLITRFMVFCEKK